MAVFLLVAVIAFVLWVTSLTHAGGRTINLHGTLLITANSNTAYSSFLYSVNPVTHAMSKIPIDSQGLQSIVEGYNHQNAWIAPYGIFMDTQNSYVLCLSLSTGQITKVPIKGNGPVRIISNKMGVFVISQGNGLIGELDKSDPKTKQVVRSRTLKGMLNAITTGPNGTVYVAGDFINPGKPRITTAYYAIDGNTLKTKRLRVSNGPPDSNSLLYWHDRLFVANGSDMSQKGYGTTVTVLDSRTLKPVTHYSVGLVPNEILQLPGAKSILVLKYYPRSTLPLPYGIRIFPATERLETMKVPESAGAVVVGNHLWCVTFGGELVEVPLGGAKGTWKTSLPFGLKPGVKWNGFFPSDIAFMR